MKWENRDINLIQDGHILLKEDPKKYMNYVAATPPPSPPPMSSADISTFPPEISKFCYIKKYTYKLHFGS